MNFLEWLPDPLIVKYGHFYLIGGVIGISLGGCVMFLAWWFDK